MDVEAPTTPRAPVRHLGPSWSTTGRPAGGGSVRLLHISDLHLCVQSMRDRIKQACERFSRAFPWVYSEIAFADDQRLGPLAEFVLSYDPQVICVTGDLSAFGDAASLGTAGAFLEGLRHRDGGPPRVVLTVPGNHDAMEAQLRHLLFHEWTKLPWYLRTYAWRYVRPVRQLLHRLSADATGGPGGGQRALLANYYGLERRFPGISYGRPFARKIEGVPLVVLPFNTVSEAPFWMNRGDTPEEQYAGLRNCFRDLNHRKDGVYIAMVHHHLVSSADVIEPSFVHAYNSTPGASRLLREMQALGIDLVLHGHQHQWNEYAVDFTMGRAPRLQVMGIPSATFGRPCGVNCIEVFPGRQIATCRHEYRNGAFEPVTFGPPAAAHMPVAVPALG